MAGATGRRLTEEATVQRYLIERGIPGAGSFTDEDMRKIATKSNEVLAGLAPRAQWVRSYVTDDHIYCFHLAEDEDTVRQHAAGGGFPADKVSVVRRVIDPMTAEDGA